MCTEPLRYTWFKANGPVPDDQRVHSYLLAYASDFPLPVRRHCSPRVSCWEPGHAGSHHQITPCGFHREFRLDDWLLYVVDSPRRQRRSRSGTQPVLHPAMACWWRAPCRKRGDPVAGAEPAVIVVRQQSRSRWLPFQCCAMQALTVGAECWLATAGRSGRPQGR